jgi:hypothetical protein
MEEEGEVALECFTAQPGLHEGLRVTVAALAAEEAVKSLKKILPLRVERIE